MPRITMPRLSAALVLAFAFGTASASAQETAPSAETDYANVLRTINPHLQAQQSRSFARSILADAQRTNLDPRLIMALVTVESHWRPNAVSRVGARGLGQLMPTTAATLGVNAWDPAQNLRGASNYLRTLVDHFASHGINGMRFAIGAYNAGPHAVEKYHGIPPYTETQNYVKRVLAVWKTLNARVGRALSASPEAASTGDRMWLERANESALPTAALIDGAQASTNALPTESAPAP